MPLWQSQQTSGAPIASVGLYQFVRFGVVQILASRVAAPHSQRTTPITSSTATTLATLSALNKRPVALPPAAANGLCVGFSGGVDSTVLLAALARDLRDIQPHSAPPIRLTAIYIAHQGFNPHNEPPAQNNATAWREATRAFCAAHHINYQTITVNAAKVPRLGPEASARRARFQGFWRKVPTYAVLALGHHAEDNIENWLLQSARGSAAPFMVEHAWLAERLIWRPLLHASKADILAYARTHHLPYVEDPSNELGHDANNRKNAPVRSRIRAQVVPPLKTIYPDINARIAQSAALSAQQDAALNYFLRATLKTLSIAPCASRQQLHHQPQHNPNHQQKGIRPAPRALGEVLDIVRFNAYPFAVRAHLLKAWLAPITIEQRFIKEMLRTWQEARESTHTVGAYRLYQWQGRVYFSAPPAKDYRCYWQQGAGLAVPHNARLSSIRAPLKRTRLANGVRLNQWAKAHHIPPFWRGQPLLFADDVPIAWVGIAAFIPEVANSTDWGLVISTKSTCPSSLSAL